MESVALLAGKGAAVNARNHAGATALMHAVDDLAKTRLLLEQGADPNIRSGEKRTALMIAAANAGALPVVKLLLEKGADAKLLLPVGLSALALAITPITRSSNVTLSWGMATDRSQDQRDLWRAAGAQDGRQAGDGDRSGREAAADGLKSLADGVEMIEPFPQPEAGEVVGADLSCGETSGVFRTA